MTILWDPLDNMKGDVCRRHLERILDVLERSSRQNGGLYVLGQL